MPPISRRERTLAAIAFSVMWVFTWYAMETGNGLVVLVVLAYLLVVLALLVWKYRSLSK